MLDGGQKSVTEREFNYYKKSKIDVLFLKESGRKRLTILESELQT